MSENKNASYLPTMKLSAVSSEASPGTQAATYTPDRSVPANFAPPGRGLSSSLDTPQPTMYMTSLPSSKKPGELERALRTRCRQLGVSLFLQDDTSVTSLGFTSAIAGEGKTFLARLTAEVMAEDNGLPVTLLECNWENPTLGSVYNLGSCPGLSDWLLGRCPLEAIRRPITSCLTVIPAGSNIHNIAQMLRAFQQRGVQSVLTIPNEALIIDLPPMVTTAYGPLAAQLAAKLILVIHMGVTPEPFVAEACHYLKNLPVHGVIFNQVTSRIPHWLRRIL